MMVSFTNHYNAIFIAKLISKTKIGKHSWYFNNSFLYKPDVCSAIKTFLFLLKTQIKNKHSCSGTLPFKSGSCGQKCS